MPDLVTLERPEEGVALITMTNPQVQNFGTWEGIDQLAAAMTEARKSGAQVSVLASGVPGHWYEHAWLADLQLTFRGKQASGDPASWFKALTELAKPEVIYIAAINGDCSGGGVELGWASDLRVAEEQALFGQPEVMIGVATGVGGSCRLARLIGRTVAAEMVLDGAPLTAQRLYELGGINRVVAEGKAVEVSLEWAARIASRRHESVTAMKQMLNDNENLHLDDALANEQKLFQGVAGTKEGFEGMKRTQARFDAGETPRDVYGLPRD